MQTLLMGLIAVFGGESKTLDFDCSGAAPVKQAWTPTKTQARNAIHRYIKSAVTNMKQASGLPVKCDHAGAVKTSRVKFTPSAATGSVGVLAYHMGKLADQQKRDNKAATRLAGLVRAIESGGVWIARGVFDTNGDIRGFPSQRKAAAAWCRTFVGPDWHTAENKADLKKEGRTHTQQVAWLILGDGTTVTTEGGISQDEVILLTAQEFGFKGKTTKGAQAFLDRDLS